MTKAALRSLLKNTLAQVDKVSKYHDTYLDHVIEICLNSVYFQVHEQNPRALGQYTKRYRTQTIADGDIGRDVYDLTVTLVPLPDKRGGVRAIMNETDTDVYYVPITDQESFLITEAQAKAITTTTPRVVYFIVHPDKIEFIGMTVTELFHPHSFDFIVAFTSLADADEVPLPYGKNIEIIKMALEMIGVIPPKDLLDNNAER